MDRYRNIRNIFPAILLAANLGAAEAPPHPGASGNYGGSKGGPQLCPFVWQGKIYVLGSTERIYCLDAKTGKEIWQSHTGWSATGKYKLLQDCIAANQGFPRNRSMEYSLTVADLGGGKAVVVCSDGRGKLHQKDGYPYTQGAGLIGLDALTGKRLWQTGEGLIGNSTPVRWTHKGRTHILAPTKAVTCIDPANGRVLWSVPCDRTGMGLVADEDHMVCNVNGVATCFRITPEKAERLWSLPSGYALGEGYFYPVIYRGHLYSAFKGEDLTTCVRMSDGEIVADGVTLGGGHTGGGMFMIAGEGRVFSSGIAVTGVEENTKPVTGSPWRVAFAIGYLTPMDPALADGRIFIRDKMGIVCYDLRARKQETVNHGENISDHGTITLQSAAGCHRHQLRRRGICSGLARGIFRCLSKRARRAPSRRTGGSRCAAYGLSLYGAAARDQLPVLEETLKAFAGHKDHDGCIKPPLDEYMKTTRAGAN